MEWPSAAEKASAIGELGFEGTLPGVSFNEGDRQLRQSVQAGNKTYDGVQYRWLRIDATTTNSDKASSANSLYVDIACRFCSDSKTIECRTSSNVSFGLRIIGQAPNQYHCLEKGTDVESRFPIVVRPGKRSLVLYENSVPAGKTGTSCTSAPVTPAEDSG